MVSLGVEWLGQSGFLVHFPHGATVCIDPYLSHAMAGGKTRERLLPIPVPAWQLRADLVVTTHDHIDHFDEITLRPIAETPGTVFAGPSSCRDHWLAMGLPAERFLRLDQGDALEVAGCAWPRGTRSTTRARWRTPLAQCSRRVASVSTTSAIPSTHRLSPKVRGGSAPTCCWSRSTGGAGTWTARRPRS
jgi:hypothetical protein